MSNHKELAAAQLGSVRGGMLGVRSAINLGGKLVRSIKANPLNWLIGASIVPEVVQPVASYLMTPKVEPGCKLAGDEVPGKFAGKWICEPGTVKGVNGAPTP